MELSDFPSHEQPWQDFCAENLYKLPTKDQFPTRSDLWWGSVLGTLVQVASAGGQDYDWVERTLVMDNSQGEESAITFTERGFVGVFYTTESPRNPWPGQLEPNVYSLRPFFKGIPNDLLDVARKETLPCVGMEWDKALPFQLTDDPLNWLITSPDGRPRVSTITAAFWGNDDQSFAAEPWPCVFEHGAWVLYPQLLPLERALLEFRGYFDLSARTIDLVRDIYGRLRNAEGQRLTMRRSEWQLLQEDARRSHDQWVRLAEAGLPGRTEAFHARQEAETENWRWKWAHYMLAAIGIDLA